jgi:O-antigen/teichoic acid export membrane protein
MSLWNSLRMWGASPGFGRSAALLMTGTAGAQFLTAAAMPVLSRIYSPSDFGTLAVFAGVVATVSVAACLRFDVAIALPERDDDAFGLLLLSFASATGFALVAGLIVTRGATWIAELTDWKLGGANVWLVPIGIFTAATCNALQNWNIRGRSFGLIAGVRVGQSLSAVGTQLGAGLAGLGSVGLLLGHVVNTAVAVIYLATRLLRRSGSLVGNVSPAGLRQLASAYRRFPIFSTWESVANSAAIHVPIIMVATLSTTSEAGHLALAMYVMQVPLSLVGAAVGQVYLSQAPEAHREGKLAELTVGVIRRLAVSGTGPLIAIGVLAPYVFGVVFGRDWERAGWLVAWMTPWFVFQFLASPVSMALHVTGHQRAALSLQLLALLARVSAVWMAYHWFPSGIGEAYSVSGGIVYATYLAVVASIVGITAVDWAGLALALLRWTAPWLAAALLASVFLRN